MYHIRLKSALSFYSKHGCATPKSPDIYTDDKAWVDKVVERGMFELISEPEPKPEKKPEPKKEYRPDYEKLEKMTKAQLTQFAKENEIDVSKCKSRADLLVEISHHFGGSYTMMELQQEV